MGCGIMPWPEPDPGGALFGFTSADDFLHVFDAGVFGFVLLNAILRAHPEHLHHRDEAPGDSAEGSLNNGVSDFHKCQAAMGVR